MSDAKRSRASNLLSRLVLIIMLALLPAGAILLNFQRELQVNRAAQARATALQQAELVKLSLGTIVEGARQFMTAITHIDRVAQFDPACRGVLQELQSALPSYAFLAVIDREGALICSSGDSPSPAALQAMAVTAAGQDGFSIGQYRQPDPGQVAYLSLSLPFTARDGVRGGVVLAGLSVTWLGDFLTSIKNPADGVFSVADRNGILVARHPHADRYIGHEVLPEVRALLHQRLPGTTIVATFEGARSIVGYVPDTVAPIGLFVSAGFLLGTLTADIDAGAWRGYLTIAAAALLSLLLALLVGQRLVKAPTDVLLRAASALEQGDLSARAELPRGSAREFLRIGEAFNAMARTLETQRGELQSLNTALEARVEERTQALLDANNRLQFGIAEREVAEARLRHTQKLQAVGQLAGGIARDFDNLLTAVLGSLELLRRRIAPAEPDLLRLLDTAKAAVERATRVTSKLLGFSRKQPLLTIPIDVAATIEGMAALLASTLGAEIWMETRLSPDLWATAIDPNQFETAILNLVLNARDAMPSGGRLVIAAANRTIAAEQASPDLPAGEYVSVTVTDSGRGMSPAVLARAGEPFFTTKGLGMGAGLGLSQVHGLARQSEGDVRIDSREGRGTRVTMLLPRSLLDPMQYASTAPAALSSQPQPDRTVLLVDDDDDVRDVTASLLMDGGFTVVQAASGPAALVCLADPTKRIRFVVADFAMPGMSGQDLLRQVRQIRPDLPVLLITGHANFTAASAEEWARGHILRKPFRGKELIAAIETIWRRNTGPDADLPRPNAE